MTNTPNQIGKVRKTKLKSNNRLEIKEVLLILTSAHRRVDQVLLNESHVGNFFLRLDGEVCL